MSNTCNGLQDRLFNWIAHIVYQQGGWENIDVRRTRKEYLWTQVQEFISIQENII